MVTFKRPDPDAEPAFNTSELGRLFGVDDHNISGRWIATGLLHGVRQGSGNRGTRYAVSPAAVLAFVRQHPDAYDWRAITDEALRAEAERIDRRDPLVGIEEVATAAGLPLDVVRQCAYSGAFATIRRREGGKGGKLLYWIRRSKVAAAAEAVRAIARRTSPLEVLHELLAPVKEEQPSPAAKPLQLTAQAQPAPTQTTVMRTPAAPARADRASPEPRAESAKRCARCGSRMIVTRSDDPDVRGMVAKCLPCGEEEALPRARAVEVSAG